MNKTLTVSNEYYFYQGFESPKKIDINDLTISHSYKGDLTEEFSEEHNIYKDDHDDDYNEQMNGYGVYRNPIPEDFIEFNREHGLDDDAYLDDFKSDFFSNKHYVFKDLQTRGYSAHTTIEGLSEMLIEDWLETVVNDENYEDEYEYECKKWENPTRKHMIEIIENSDFRILKPTESNVKDYEIYHDHDYFKNCLKS